MVTQLKREFIILWLLGLFFAVFMICAIILQILDGELSPTSASVFDLFSGGLLWIASFIALLIAVDRIGFPLKLVMWLTVSAAAGALAIDEVFEFHERSSVVIGDDDYIKALLWLFSGIGLYVINRLENPHNYVTFLFVVGYVFQTAYLLIDVGDGDFYELPLRMDIATWAEEILEMLFVQCYLAGLTLHLAMPPASREPPGLSH